jgi:hypothetical protein
MVVYQRTHRRPGWKRRLAVNLTGAIVTGIVLLVVGVSKFAQGAWIPLVVIPLIVALFKGIRRHYDRVRKEVTVDDDARARRRFHTAVVLVGSVNKGTLAALGYARSLSPDRLVAVSVISDHLEQEALTKSWVQHEIPVELHTIYSPYRSLTQPILQYLDELEQVDKTEEFLTVIIPEVVVKSVLTQPLHNQSAFSLKARLLFRPNTVVTSVPVVLD